MRISIITVCFNSAATVRDTLRSVAGQTHPDIEHIIIDGGSKDRTLEVIAEEKGRVAVCISEPDQGIYDAMNKGLGRATGELIGFLNADDVFAVPDAVAKIVAAADSGSDAVYGDLVYVRQANLDSPVRHWRSGAFSAWQLRFGWMPPHPTFYVRRDLLSKIGRFDTALRVAADYDFMVRCLTQTGVTVSYVPAVLVKMRLGGVSNASAATMARKSQEDLLVIRRHALGGWFTLASKNFRKLPQFLPWAVR